MQIYMTCTLIIFWMLGVLKHLQRFISVFKSYFDSNVLSMYFNGVQLDLRNKLLHIFCHNYCL